MHKRYMCLYGDTINVYMMMYIYMATLWVLLLCGASHGIFLLVFAMPARSEPSDREDDIGYAYGSHPYHLGI